MKTQVEKPVTKAQISKIHVLLQQKGLLDEKKAMIYSISDGRTDSTKDITSNEARRLIAFLLDENSEIKEKIKIAINAIWKIAWEMGIIYGKTEDDYNMNIAKMNMFCRQRGAVKKNFTEMTFPELQKVHRQFEAMYRKHKLKISLKG
jgi:hypothetical protein